VAFSRSHALARGAELTSVRDNLRHTLIATASMYLCGGDLTRAWQITGALDSRNATQRPG
jgi:hypothetical protein